MLKYGIYIKLYQHVYFSCIHHGTDILLSFFLLNHAQNLIQMVQMCYSINTCLNTQMNLYTSFQFLILSCHISNLES